MASLVKISPVNGSPFWLDVSVPSLDLRWSSIGVEGATALATSTGLTKLDLSHNSIGDEGAAALAGSRSLVTLNLWDNSIGPKGATALAAITSLTSLNLDGNYSIGDEGAKALAGSSSLTSLNLWDNSINGEGAKALASSKSLTSLDLGWNLMGDEGWKHFLGNSLIVKFPYAPVLLETHLKNNRSLQIARRCKVLIVIAMLKKEIKWRGSKAASEASPLYFLPREVNLTIFSHLLEGWYVLSIGMSRQQIWAKIVDSSLCFAQTG